MKKDPQELFWSKVNKETLSGCWEWTASKDRDGYGRWRNSQEGNWMPHRYSIKLSGKDPKGWKVLHNCDNPSCVNPDHLRLGTVSDNMKDRSTRGRWAGPKRCPITGHWLPKEIS